MGEVVVLQFCGLCHSLSMHRATMQRHKHLVFSTNFINPNWHPCKMNPFMSDRCECEWFVGPEIPSCPWLLQSSTHLAQGESTLVP